MPVINKPIQYFAANTWNGSGTSTVTVNFGFQPDLVWIKPRNNVASNANSHILIDSVRGSDKILRSDTTGAEVTESNNIVAFTSTGITIGDSHNVNKNTTSQYVAWAWKKGATQGFDIVTYAGQNSSGRTVAHSLGVKPAMIIIKNRSGAFSWNVQHQSLSGGVAANASTFTLSNFTSVLALNLTAAASAYTYDQQIDGVGNNLVAYLFAEVAGFSKFGSYTGNGAADGPFVFCGFRPRWIMMKSSSAVNNWTIYDTVRDANNVGASVLYPNTSGAEPGAATALDIDILSNGFKWREAGGQGNDNGQTYIFAAFAESPFKYALAR